jgi:hypothetical protein
VTDIEVIVPGFPGIFGNTCYSDSEHNVVWMKNGRGLYGLDVETKEHAHSVITNDYTVEIRPDFLADAEENIIFIDIVPPWPEFNHFVLYNINKNEIIFKSEEYGGQFFPFKNKTMFFSRNITINEKDGYEWQIVDFSFKKVEENTLTKNLSKFAIDAWPHSKTIHVAKRILFGNSEATGKLVYFTARWDEEFEDVKVEPLLLQHPRETYLDDRGVFSSTGNWLKSQIERKKSFPDLPELVFFHVDNAYPQGLSMPIYCGYTSKYAPGAFMEHTEWGPCYVEVDLDHPDKLFVFKLNDGLQILADQAMDGVGE